MTRHLCLHLLPLVPLLVFLSNHIPRAASSTLRHAAHQPKKHRRRRQSPSPPADYGGSHPFELMEAQRQRVPEKETRNKPNMARLSDGRDTDGDNFNRDLFQPLRIGVDYRLLSGNFKAKNVFIENEVMPAAIKFWSSALSVYPASMIQIIPDNCQPLEGADITIEDFDLMLYVMGVTCPKGVLASAASCEYDQYDRPIAGIVEFCYGAITLQSDGTANADMKELTIDNAIHEIGHVLGMKTSAMAYFYDINTGLPRTPRDGYGYVEEKAVKCIKGDVRDIEDMPSENTIAEGTTSSGVRYFEVVTPTVAKVVQNHFNCPTMRGARLENQPTGNDCFGDHWEERLFFDDNLSAVAANSKFPDFVTPLTLALLEDSGWYIANYSMASVSPFGHGAGCDFVNEKCIVDGEVPSYSEGYFCASTDISNDFQCDPSHTVIANCDTKNHDDIPIEFQYFADKKIGAITWQADFCPTWTSYVKSCKNSQFGGTKLPGEVYGENSRCFNTDSSNETESAIPVCLEASCNKEKRAIEVLIDGTTHTCDSDGQTFTMTDSLSFVCPKFSSMCPDMVCPANCAGRGICDFSSDQPKCLLEVKFEVKFTIELAANNNLLNDAELKEAGKVLAKVTNDLLSDGWTARIIFIDETAFDELAQRRLEGYGVEIISEVITKADCDTEDCSNGKTKAELSFDGANPDMKKAIDDNSLETLIEKEAKAADITSFQDVSLKTDSFSVRQLILGEKIILGEKEATAKPTEKPTQSPTAPPTEPSSGIRLLPFGSHIFFVPQLISILSILIL